MDVEYENREAVRVRHMGLYVRPIMLKSCFPVFASQPCISITPGM
jgi:hypothetical protein